VTVKVIKALNVECSIEGVGYTPSRRIICSRGSDLTSLYNMLVAHTHIDAKLVKSESGWTIQGSPTEGAAPVLVYKALGEEG